MTDIRAFASHVIAASTALALSLVLISGTIITPTTNSVSPVQEILA